jgi:hypothetical protein
MIDSFFKNKWVLKDGIYTIDRLIKNNLAADYDLAGGNSANERKNNVFSSTYFQNKQYSRYFDAFFEIMGSHVKTAIDVGCGDGRCIDLSNKPSIQTFYGADVNLDSLKRYHPIKQQNTVLLNIGAEQLEFRENSFDLIMAIESLYYIGKEGYFDQLRKFSAALTSGGYLITSDPEWEAGLLYAAMRGGLKDILSLTQTQSSFEEIKKGKLSLVPNINIKDFDEECSSNKLKLVRRYGISALPVLLIHLFYNSVSHENMKEDLIKSLELISNDETSFNKIYLSLYKKD